MRDGFRPTPSMSTARAGVPAASDHPEGRARDVAGHRERHRRAGAGRPSMATAGPSTVHRDAERRERALRMIARRRRFGRRWSRPRLQPGQEHGALDLGARHGGGVVDRLQVARRGWSAAGGRPAAVDRAPMRVSGSMTRRIGRAASDASPPIVVCERMGGEDARHQADRGAGVAGVERAVGAAEPAQAAARRSRTRGRRSAGRRHASAASQASVVAQSAPGE